MPLAAVAMLSTARTSMRLDEAWVAKLQAAQPSRSQVLSVAQLSHDPDATHGIVQGRAGTQETKRNETKRALRRFDASRDAREADVARPREER